LSLVGRVYLLVLLAAAPAFALQLYKDLEQRAAGEAQVEAEARRLVRFASGEFDKVLEGARAFLVAVAAHPDIRAADPQACGDYLRGMGMLPPPLRGAFLVDDQGTIVCSSRPLAGDVNVADRSYFQLTRDSRRFTVGDLVVSRIDGTVSLPVALPLASTAGAVQGILAMGLSTDALQQMFQNKAWPQGGSISIVDRTGTIVVRWPNPELVGTKLPDTFHWMLDAPGEAVTSGIGPDGVERIGAFVPPSANHGVLISVALSKPAALAPLDQALRRDMALLGAVAALALAAAVLGGRYFIRRPVATLSAAAARLRAGDLSARAALPEHRSELGKLGAIFDEMAGAIEARERDLRRSEELFRQFAENLPEVVWVEDAVTGRIEYVGPAYEAIWQRPSADIREGRTNWLEAVRDTDRPRLLAALDGARGGQPTTAEYRITRPDGSERWLQSTAFPIRDPDRAVIRLARITRDVTERRAFEAEREHALRQRDLLFRELNHRIKNNLQIVRSFLVLQSGRLSDPMAKEALNAASQRIGAVGELHAMLYRGGAIGTLDLGAYLRELCGSLAEALIEEDRGVSIECRCDPLRADMDRAVLVGLIASELITNSLKYAYPAPRAGIVTVTLERRSGDEVVLTVSDQGQGFAELPAEGFGLRIIRMLVRQLDARLDFHGEGGVTASVAFSLPLQSHDAAA
jgi:PAS domain S-box-containing protein